MKTQIAALAAAGLVLTAGNAALAQSKYPTRPVELMVPSPPGGGTDAAARLLAEVIEPFLGQKMVVINKPGGGGSAGVATLLTAKSDGYTLGAVWNSPLTAVPQTLKVPYKPDSYQPVVMTSSTAYVLCAASDFPAKDGAGLLETLRANPGKYTYGNDGVGGTMQLAAERIFGAAGVKARAIPFGGAGETARNFLGGHVDLYGGSISPIVPHVTAGKAKCLLLTSAGRNTALPDASSLTDIGLAKEETLLWRAIIAPKGMAADRAAVIEKAVRQAVETPRYKEFLASQGEVPDVRGPADLRKLIDSEYKALGEVASALGLKAQ